MTRHPQQNFTVGEIIALTTGLALHGDKTFARIKALGEFRTGLPLGLDTEPDVDSDDFVTLMGWRLAVLQADNGEMWTQTVGQYPTAMLFSAIVLKMPEREEQIPALVETFKAEAKRNGIDLERPVRVTALSPAEMALAARMYGNVVYQRHCVETMLQQAAQG